MLVFLARAGARNSLGVPALDAGDLGDACASCSSAPGRATLLLAFALAARRRR
jgi:hypothetical protein